MFARVCWLQELRARLAALEQASSELTQLRARCYGLAHELQQALTNAAGDGAMAAAGSDDALGPEHLPELAHELLFQFQVRWAVLGRSWLGS